MNLSPIFSTERDLIDPFAPCFAGIYRDLLFIDYGTAPGLRGLDIYDLKVGRIVYSGFHYSGYQFTDESTVLTYRRIDTQEVKTVYPDIIKKNKADYDKYMEMGLRYSYVKVYEVDLNDFTETNTGEIMGIVEQ